MAKQQQTVVALSTNEAAVFNWNVETNLLHGDNYFAELFGLDPDEVSNGLPIEAYLARVWDGDRKRVARSLYTSISTTGPCHQDYHIVRPDGNMIHVIAVGRCFAALADEPSRYVGVLFDGETLNSAEKKDVLVGYCRAAADVAADLKETAVSSLLSQALTRLGAAHNDNEHDMTH